MSSVLAEPALQIITPEFAARTGLIYRPLTVEALDRLFDELEMDSAAEQDETFTFLKQALKQTRAAVSAEPVYRDE